MEKSKCRSVTQKKDENILKNYRPVSLLSIVSKIFERVIYNSPNYFHSKKPFTSSQSGFLPGDSCIAQQLSIIHEIQTAFDNNATVYVRGVFLDISKAFDKVCMVVFYSSYKLIGLKIDYFHYLKIIFIIVNKD